MKQTSITLILLAFFALPAILSAQNTTSVPVGPKVIQSVPCKGISKPLRDIPPLSASDIQMMEEKARKKAKNTPWPLPQYPYASTAQPKGADAAWQKEAGTRSGATYAPILTFEGQSSPYYPPDCNGATGPSHYMQTVNTTYSIYNKSGTLVAGPTAMNTLFGSVPGATYNDGDPIILYDEQAQRWVAVEFSVSGSNDYMLFAISTTSDPTGTWYQYSFDVVDMPDYEKVAVWPDGYYMGTNTQPTTGNDIYVFERSKMLIGATAQMVAFDNPYRPGTGVVVVPPVDNDGPAAPSGAPGTFIAFNDDGVGGGSDQLWIYELAVNWTTPASSSFNRTQQLNVTAFDSQFNSWEDIYQPGTTRRLCAISTVIMNVPQYRNFGTYQSIVCCHTVDVDNTDHAGIRWYELRKTPPATTWVIRQQGTYAPDAHSRWMGAISMNANSRIALGYSISSSTVYPGIRYAGQSNAGYTAAAGVLDIAEENVLTGSNYQSTYNRWGDYSSMCLDPTNDQTFWFTTEYIGASEARKTKIVSFNLGNNPIVTTNAATLITLNTATLNGTVNPNGISTTYYFQWGTSTSYGYTTTVTSAGSGTSVLNVESGITGLAPGTTYHFRLVAVNSDGTTNGNDMSFTPGGAAVTTSAISGITGTTASSGGNVTTDGGASVSARGVCWATTANPVATGSHTTDGSGTGTFSSSITGLVSNTTYYVRAYATNAYGTYYGDNVTFTTLCGIYTLPLAQSFASASLPSCWTKQQTGSATDLWTVSNTNSAGGSAYEMKSTYQNVNPAVVRLVTPPVNTVGMTQLNLSFKHFIDAYGTGCTFRVQSSSDGTNWTNETWSLASTSTNVGPATVNTTISGNLNSSSTYIAFAVDGNLYQYDYWYIDDINISSACGTTYPVSVSIAASSNNICANTSVTFTASPTNGGSTPVYAWYKNSTLVSGVTGATYTYAPSQGDVVYCILTSNLACTTGNPATSNPVTMTVNANQPVSISLSANNSTVCAGTTVTFTASPVNGGSSPVYAWYKNSSLVSGVTGATYSYVPVNGDVVYCVLTSNLTCTSGNPATSNSVTMIVNPILPVSVSLSADYLTVCSGSSVNLTATPTNGGASPVYAWYKNSILVSGVTGSTYSFVPANGDQVYVVLTSSLTCKSGSPATSSPLTFTVNTPLPVSVSINASQNPVTTGTTVTFTATPVNGGSSPVFAWYKNGTVVSGATNATYAYIPGNGDQIYAVLTSSLSCISGSPATSNTITMVVTTPTNPTYLCELRNDSICDPKVYEFDVYLLRTGSTNFELASIQLGININSAMRNGGTITVSPVPGTSELNASQQPTANKFTFDATKNCIRMVAMANPGTGNGSIISATSPGTRIVRIRLTNTVNFGTVKPNHSWCFSVAACGYPTKVNAYVGGLATEITVQGSHTLSNLINPTLNQAVTSYNVTGSGSYCQGGSGVNVCIDGSEAGIRYTLVKDGLPTSSSMNGTGSSLCFGLQGTGTYTVSGRRIGTCLTNTMSGSAIITENPPAIISVSITASENPVLAGVPVTFTASPVNGGTPGYEWYLNGTIAGSNSSSYTLTPANGDQVYVVMTSSLTGCVTGNPAMSNVVTMSVQPRVLQVNPSNQDVSSDAGTTTFSVTSNLGWTSSGDQAWCSVTPSGSGNGSITVNYEANTSIMPRVAHITVSAAGVSPVVVTVTQAGVSFKAMNLTVYLEGLYENAGIMRQAYDENGPHFGPGIADKVTVELHNETNYSIIEYTSGPVELTTSGSISISDIPAILTGSYYITVRHRSSIETTSATPVSFATSPVSYNFTSSASQAYGDNLHEMNGAYVIWGGDINQDGIVDGSDMNPVDNLSTAVTFGYVTEDANGDGIVDAGDMNIVDNNSTAIIMSFVP